MTKLCKDCAHAVPTYFFGLKFLASYEEAISYGPRCALNPKTTWTNPVSGEVTVDDYPRCSIVRSTDSTETRCGKDAKYFKNKNEKTPYYYVDPLPNNKYDEALENPFSKFIQGNKETKMNWWEDPVRRVEVKPGDILKEGDRWEDGNTFAKSAIGGVLCTGHRWKMYREKEIDSLKEYCRISLAWSDIRVEGIKEPKQHYKPDSRLLWESRDGAMLTFSAMDNEYLANVICFMTYYKNIATKFLVEAMTEVKLRKLTEKYLDGAPYPYQDKRTRQWKIWDFKVHTDVLVNGKSDA